MARGVDMTQLLNGPDTLIQTEVQYDSGVYNKHDIALVRGLGVKVWDSNGREYIDCIAGIGVASIGHSHPALVKAISDQAATLMICPQTFPNDKRAEFYDELASVLPQGLNRIFPCNSGAEANETAIKLARRYYYDRKETRFEVISAVNSFHGRTLATVTATGQPKYHKNFAPLVQGFDYVSYNDIAALEAAVTKYEGRLCAIMLEPLQGEGGVNPFHMDYLKDVRKLCDERDWLLMIDEVQCGMGRTGKWFAHQWAGIKPDVMPLAKGLGSGVPIGAVVAGPKAAHIFAPGNHGTTFGGNPLAMRAGVETIRIMEEDNLLENAFLVGGYLKAAFIRELAGVAGIREVRGMGLMLGIDLAKPCGALVGRCADAGLLISVTADSVIRLVPPLILTKAEADEMVGILVPLIKAILLEN